VQLQIPIASKLNRSRRLICFEDMTGHQLADAGEQRTVSRQIAKSQVLGQHLVVELCLDSRVSQDRLNLRAEQQPLWG